MILSSQIISGINERNCINEAEIFSKCSFEIKINPPSSKPMKCILKFTQPNNGEVAMINKRWNLKPKENNSCPFIELSLCIGKTSEKVD